MPNTLLSDLQTFKADNESIWRSDVRLLFGKLVPNVCLNNSCRISTTRACSIWPLVGEECISELVNGRAQALENSLKKNGTLWKP
jgi:hypothetical protein